MVFSLTPAMKIKKGKKKNTQEKPLLSLMLQNQGAA
jgi:hypothetical protein